MSAGVADPADRPEVVALRTRVFVDEQGVPPETERDDADAIAVHAVSRDDAGRVVATGRLLERDGVAVIGRMATDAGVRGQGHGAAGQPGLNVSALAVAPNAGTVTPPPTTSSRPSARRAAAGA